MDCLICFKIFIKEKEYENISPPKSDICARSICKLLEIQNSSKILEIFQDPGICSKCYQKLEDVHKEIIRLEELKRKIEGIRVEVQKDLENSKNVSQVMQNAYGGEMSKSSKDRLKLLEAIKKIAPDGSSTNKLGGQLNRKNCPEVIGKTRKSRYSMHFYCKICKRRYSSKYSLSKHMNQHSEVKPYESLQDFTCLECGKAHSSKEELNVHLESVLTSTNIQKCSVCPEEFWGSQCLEYHKVFHHNKELDIKYRADKKKLIKTNYNSKMWECGVCKLKFKINSNLKKHQLIHGPKKFKCSFKGCEKKFHRNYELKRHEFRHSEQKPYHCQYCSRGFIDKRCLITHLGDEKPSICGICKQNFKSKGCLRHHRSISHGISYYTK